MIEDLFIGLGIAISIEQIETILGIVLLVIQIALILSKFGIALYQKIKEKKSSKEVIQDIDEVSASIGKVVNQYYASKDTTPQIENKRNE